MYVPLISHNSDLSLYIYTRIGRKLKGYVHSLDEKSDIALVKISDVSYAGTGISSEELPVVTLGTSGNLRVG